MKRSWAWMLALAVVLPAAVSADAVDQAARAQALIDKGLAFLKTQQKEDGGWQGTREPPAITALALKAFLQDVNYTKDSPLVKKAMARLLAQQSQEGAIYTDSLANYNTAIVLTTLVAANDPELKPSIEKATAYLRTLQWAEGATGPKGEKVDAASPWYGGWGYGGHSRGGGRPDLSNTQLALEALHAAGVKNDDPAYQRAMQFVTQLQNNSETNKSAWAGNDGGFIYGPSDDGKGESFAGEVVGPDGQRRLKSYGSMSYSGLKVFVYAGLSKDDPRVQAAWRWITQNWTLAEHPGLAGEQRDGRWGLYYYYHTLARTLRVFGEPVITTPDGKKHDWRVELIDALAKQQGENGAWVGLNKWMENSPVLVTSYNVLALQEVLASLKEHPVRAE